MSHIYFVISLYKHILCICLNIHFLKDLFKILATKGLQTVVYTHIYNSFCALKLLIDSLKTDKQSKCKSAEKTDFVSTQ